MFWQLRKKLFNQGVISSDRNEHIIELAMLCAVILQHLYQYCATSHEQFKIKNFLFLLLNKRKIYKLQNTCDFPSITTTYQLLYQQHMLYSEPVAGQWLIAHQLYDAAVQYKYHLTNINHIQGTASTSQYYSGLCSIILWIFLIPIKFVKQKFKPVSM
jgi:hypothetical protein